MFRRHKKLKCDGAFSPEKLQLPHFSIMSCSRSARVGVTPFAVLAPLELPLPRRDDNSISEKSVLTPFGPRDFMRLPVALHILLLLNNYVCIPISSDFSPIPDIPSTFWLSPVISPLPLHSTISSSSSCLPLLLFQHYNALKRLFCLIKTNQCSLE